MKQASKQASKHKIKIHTKGPIKKHVRKKQIINKNTQTKQPSNQPPEVLKTEASLNQRELCIIMAVENCAISGSTKISVR